MSLSYPELQKTLMDDLRLMHQPIAVKFFFNRAEVEEFKANVDNIYTPARPLSFCQWEIAPRMKGKTILAEKKNLGCANASFVFGWRSFSESEVKSHQKYARDRDQAERFVNAKPRLPEGELEAIAVSPLSQAHFQPDTVHFYVDNMQAYHLATYYMAALDVPQLRPAVGVNSSACGGNVFSYTEKTFNLVPACSGSYNAGKTERGEINAIIPGEHIGLVVEELLRRKQEFGSASITSPGDHFPGADVCKNCPMIDFKPLKNGAIA